MLTLKDSHTSPIEPWTDVREGGSGWQPSWRLSDTVDGAKDTEKLELVPIVMYRIYSSIGDNSELFEKEIHTSL